MTDKEKAMKEAKELAPYCRCVEPEKIAALALRWKADGVDRGEALVHALEYKAELIGLANEIERGQL